MILFNQGNQTKPEALLMIKSGKQKLGNSSSKHSSSLEEKKKKRILYDQEYLDKPS